VQQAGSARIVGRHGLVKVSGTVRNPVTVAEQRFSVAERAFASTLRTDIWV
jgi:hypothetical protein